MGALSGLHVLVVPSWWPSPQAPLSGIFNQDYVRAFADAGAKVGVIAVDFIHLRMIVRTRDIPLRPRLCWESLDGSPVLRIRGLHTALGQPALHMKRFRSWLQRGLAEYRKRHGQPDVLHALVAIPAGWACTHLDDPLASRVVLTEMTGPFSLAMTPPAQARFVRDALVRATRVVAVSRLSRHDIHAHGIHRDIDVCGIPVDREFLDFVHAPRAAIAPRHALFAGRIVADKGVFDLAEAIRDQDWARSIEWHFAGDGPALASLKNTFSNLPLHVVFHGHCRRTRIVTLMAEADFFVFPSHYETFGLAAAEALCMGLPIITTRRAACEAFVDDSNGLVVNSHCPVDLREAIRKLVDRLPDYDRLAIARRARQIFSGRAVADFYAALFQRIAQ